MQTLAEQLEIAVAGCLAKKLSDDQVCELIRGLIEVTDLDTQQAADELGVHEATLRNWRNLNTGPEYHHVGRKIIYTSAGLRRFKQKSRVAPRGQGTG